MQRLYGFLLPLIGAILLFCSSNLHWGGDNWKGLIVSDGKGYYSYLPAIFIYQDLSFGFFEKVEQEYYYENTYYDYRAGHEGETVNKYYAGTAAAMMPFFLGAHAVAALTDNPADGYSKPYPVAINIAAVFYLLAGLWFLKKLLESYKAEKWMIAIILPAIAFGTNAFYYALCEPAMSHIYSFGFISMFLFHIRSFYLTQHNRNILWAAFALGMIVLIRPVNAMIVLALPFLAGSTSGTLNGLRAVFSRPHVLIGIIFLPVAIASIQLVLYKIQTGSFFVYSYGSEGFNWSDPQLFNILFSYKKGLFVYTPLWLLALPGFIGMWRENGFAGISLFIFLALVTYVLSSWWNWYYGGSFSSRVYIEYLPFLGLLLMYSLRLFAHRAARATYAGIALLLVLYCQFQTYQYRYYIIHWENMTEEKFWEVFLRL